MESEYFTRANIMDSVTNVCSKNVASRDVYDRLFISKGHDSSNLQASQLLMRQNEVQPAMQGAEDLNQTYDSNIERYYTNKDVTNFDGLQGQKDQKLYSPRHQKISAERSKKRYIKHYGSAKTASRKSRFQAAPRRVASGPAKVEDSSSSSDESQDRQNCRLISAPDPAPSNQTKVNLVRCRKRSPMDRSKNSNKNKKELTLQLPLSRPNCENENMATREVSNLGDPNDANLFISQKLSPSIPYRENNMISLNSKQRSTSTPRPLNIPGSRDLSPSGYLAGNPNSPGFLPKSPCSPRSPRSPITRQRSPRLSPGYVSSPRYTMTPQLSHLPTIHHSPEQISGASSRSSTSNRTGDDLLNETLRSPRSPTTPTNYNEPSNRMLNNTANGPIGNLALLASRRRSVAAHCVVYTNRTGRPSNFLEIPGNSFYKCPIYFG